MPFGDVLYIIAMVMFVFITFGIIKNYYKSKFDDEGRRMDMHEDYDKTNKK